MKYQNCPPSEQAFSEHWKRLPSRKAPSDGISLVFTVHTPKGGRVNTLTDHPPTPNRIWG